MTSEVKLEPTAEEIERVARAICLERGYDPDFMMGRMDVGGMFPTWQCYETQARAAILAMDRRASPPAEPVAWRARINPYGQPGWAYAERERTLIDEGRHNREPLYASPPAPAVAVVPLEWFPHDVGRQSGWTAFSPFGDRYKVYLAVLPDGWKCDRLGELFPSREEAQSAAQADYEQRIRSALVEPAPAERCRDCDGYNCDDGCAYPAPAQGTK